MQDKHSSILVCEGPACWLAEFLLCSFAADVLFVFHRAVHSKGLYVRLHKMHHEWIYTIALAHHYMDTLGCHIYVTAYFSMILGSTSHRVSHGDLYTTWRYSWTLHIHDSYPIKQVHKWIPFINSEYHDLHHLRFNVNYGAVWPVSIVFGTYREEPAIYIDGIREPNFRKKVETLGERCYSRKREGHRRVSSGDTVATTTESASKRHTPGASLVHALATTDHRTLQRAR